MQQLKWTTDKRECELIDQICDRAINLPGYQNHPEKGLYDEISMCLSTLNATHLKIDLEGLLASHDLSFEHDVQGICGRLNKSTGRLPDGWRPRFLRGVV